MKQLALFGVLSLIAMPAFAAIGVSVEGLVEFVVYLLVIGLIFGILLFIVARAPFIPPEWKNIINWIIYLIGALMVINILLSFAGHPIFNIR